MICITGYTIDLVCLQMFLFPYFLARMKLDLHVKKSVKIVVISRYPFKQASLSTANNGHHFRRTTLHFSLQCLSPLKLGCTWNVKVIGGESDGNAMSVSFFSNQFNSSIFSVKSLLDPSQISNHSSISESGSSQKK